MNKYSVAHISRHRMGIDGNGIRTLVLTGGCPLRCRYCINPQTWNGNCEFEKLTAYELYDKVKIDIPYFLATNGGITFGGGEPLLQPRLITEIRELCTEDITINVETSLHVEWKNIEEVIDCVDMFYVDIKSMDAAVYKQYTGGNLDMVMFNLKKLMGRRGNKSITVRIPEIPDFVDKEMQLDAKEKVLSLGISKIDLFRYRLT